MCVLPRVLVLAELATEYVVATIGQFTTCSIVAVPRVLAFDYVAVTTQNSEATCLVIGVSVPDVAGTCFGLAGMTIFKGLSPFGLRPPPYGRGLSTRPC